MRERVRKLAARRHPVCDEIWRVDRARQLLGDLLILLTLAVAGGGAFLAGHYAITDEVVAYTGPYEALQGVEMPAAYESTLTISFDVPGGLLVRQLHYSYSTALLVGLVIWAVIGAFRYALPAFALAAGRGLRRNAARRGQRPVPMWFALHVVAALGMVAILVVASRREARDKPITFGYVAAVLGVLVALALF